ncbi:MAG: ATP-binding protein [Acidimicrobiales bacterium]
MTLRRSPQLRAAIIALALAVVVVGALGAWQVTAARDSQRTQIENGELTAARLSASAVQSGILSQLQLVSNLAEQNVEETIRTTPDLQKLANEVRSLYPQFATLSVDSANGLLLAVSPKNEAVVGTQVSDKPAFAGAVKTGKSYVSRAFRLPGGGPLVIGLAAPFFDQTGKTLEGVIVGTIAISHLGSIIGSTELHSGGSFVVLDQTGRALTGPAAASGTTYAHTDAASKALFGYEGTGTATLPGFSGSLLVAYTPVAHLGWGIVVEQPMSELNDPIGTLTVHLALIDALVVLIAVVAAFLLSRLLGQLAKERDEAAAVMASVGEGVATVDAAGRVVRLNPALEKLSGRTTTSARGRQWTDVFPFVDDRNQVLTWSDSVVARAMSERMVVASHGFSKTLLAANGTNIPVAVTAAPLITDDGQITGAVAVVRDVSREREVDELKSSLVSTVSHELRTPLTMIRGFSELLLSRRDLDAKRSEEALQHIHDSSRRLGRLIDDLLSVSRIESGGLSSELRPIELIQVAQEVLVTLESTGGNRVDMDLSPGLPAVLADPDQLFQVLTNLLSNALKYSSEASRVQMSAVVARDQVHVSVSDEGIGMTPGEAAQVFGKFARVDRPEVREVGGTGLGLYITRRLVDMMGGSIWVRSKTGEGSVFTFSLRIGPAEDRGVVVKEQAYAQAVDR